MVQVFRVRNHFGMVRLLALPMRCLQAVDTKPCAGLKSTRMEQSDPKRLGTKASCSAPLNTGVMAYDGLVEDRNHIDTSFHSA